MMNKIRRDLVVKGKKDIFIFLAFETYIKLLIKKAFNKYHTLSGLKFCFLYLLPKYSMLEGDSLTTLFEFNCILLILSLVFFIISPISSLLPLSIEL